MYLKQGQVCEKTIESVKKKCKSRKKAIMENPRYTKVAYLYSEKLV